MARPKKNDPTPQAERYRLASELVVAEYSALRAESLQALTSAQSSVRWSLSTFGVLFAAGLLASYQTIGAGAAAAEFLTPVILLVFGFVFPGLCCIGAWAWLADHARYERVAGQIRRVEERIATIPDLVGLLDAEPIRQERFKAETRLRGHPEARFGHQRLANLSTSGVFFGAIISSEAVFVIWHAHVYGWRLNLIAIAWLALAATMLVLFLFVSLRQGRRTQRLRTAIPSMLLFHESPDDAWPDPAAEGARKKAQAVGRTPAGTS